MRGTLEKCEGHWRNVRVIGESYCPRRDEGHWQIKRALKDKEGIGR